jgi:hypothetical protein
MSSPATLPLSNIVNVTVLISPQAPAQPQFNQGLIVGNSGVIPSSGANSRIRQYTGLAGMLTDGFTTSSPEYLAASLYFSQQPSPQFLWVGCQDPAGLNVVIPHSGNAGTGYQVGDVITPTQGSSSGGTLKVTTIGGGGAVTGLTLVTSGTGYSVATALATTGGHGTGLEVDISSIGEPALQAVIACRAKSYAWYGFMVTDAADADHLALALWAQTASPYVVYFYNTADAAVLNNTGGNIAAVMQADNYNRAIGIYSTTQSGLFPNNTYASAAMLGTAMGLTTELANSYFTMKFKVLTGVGTEPLTQTQITSLEGLNINLYLDYANAYTIFEQGVMANGQFFDEISNIDILVSNIQYGIMNLLTESPSVPQTDPGEAQLIHAVNQACETSRQVGFIAGGVWQGVQIVNLQPGTTLPKGYLAQAYPYSTQSASDRAARKAMPIYLAIIESGAVHFVQVQIFVQR